MDQLTANRYARALFQIAYDKGEIDGYFNQLNAVYEAIVKDEDFMNVICHPDIVLDEKIGVIEKVFKGKVFDDILGFFYVILRKKREKEILNIFESFINMVWEHKRIVIAVVSSAVPLSESQIYDIKVKLSQKLNKQVEVKVEIDTDLIAGLKVTVDNRVIDASVKYQFENIKKELLQVQLV